MGMLFCCWFYSIKSWLIQTGSVLSPWYWSDDYVVIWQITVWILALHGLLFLSSKRPVTPDSMQSFYEFPTYSIQLWWLQIAGKSLPHYLKRFWTGSTDWQSLSHNVLISYGKNTSLTSYNFFFTYVTIWYDELIQRYFSSTIKVYINYLKKVFKVLKVFSAHCKWLNP